MPLVLSILSLINKGHEHDTKKFMGSGLWSSSECDMIYTASPK